MGEWASFFFIFFCADCGGNLAHVGTVCWPTELDRRAGARGGEGMAEDQEEEDEHGGKKRRSDEATKGKARRHEGSEAECGWVLG